MLERSSRVVYQVTLRRWNPGYTQSLLVLCAGGYATLQQLQEPPHVNSDVRGELRVEARSEHIALLNSNDISTLRDTDSIQTLTPCFPPSGWQSRHHPHFPLKCSFV